MEVKMGFGKVGFLVLWSILLLQCTETKSDPFLRNRQNGCSKDYILKTLAGVCKYHKRGSKLFLIPPGSQIMPGDPLKVLPQFYFNGRTYPDPRQAHYAEIERAYFVHDKIESGASPVRMYDQLQLWPAQGQNFFGPIPNESPGMPYFQNGYEQYPWPLPEVQPSPELALERELENSFWWKPSGYPFTRWKRNAIVNSLLYKCCSAQGCKTVDFVSTGKHYGICDR